MKIYTIIAGVNGVGKSSLTGALKSERNDLGEVIDIDKYAFENKCGAIEAGKLAVAKIAEFMERQISFSQETTLSGRKTEKTVKLAKEKGYYIRLYYVGLNDNFESIKRIKNRVEKGGHHIPDDDVNRRFDKRFEDLLKIFPYCDEIVLFDNDNGFVEVGKFFKESGLIFGVQKPYWLNELVCRLQGE